MNQLEMCELNEQVEMCGILIDKKGGGLGN